jgi:hypothetical protein
MNEVLGRHLLRGCHSSCPARAAGGPDDAAAFERLLLQPTGNPSQYEVMADEQVVGRISLSALSKTASPGYGRSTPPSIGIPRTASKRREAAIEAFVDPGSPLE